MKLGFISDVHVGNASVFPGSVELGMNQRCRDTIDALREAVKCAWNMGVHELFILGDLFDTHRPIPQMVKAVRDALAGVNVTILRGNHDARTDREHDDAISVIQSVSSSSRIRVMSNPGALLVHGPRGQMARAIVVPHRSDRPMRQAVKETVRGSDLGGGLVNFLLFHAGLQDDTTPAYLRSDDATVDTETLAEIMQEREGIAAAFCGDWHTPKDLFVCQDPRPVVQVGSLVPTDFGETGFDQHGLVTWDLGSLYPSRTIVPGPRLVKAPSPTPELWDEIAAKLAIGEATKVYASFHPTTRELADQARAECEANAAYLEGWRVLPDVHAVKERAGTQVQSVREARTLDAALAAHCAALSLPAGVTADEVYHRVRAILSET